MVNYCCVRGCGRNSKVNRHLKFYVLPKEKHRQEEWLKASHREDLLAKDMIKRRQALRICSRHFSPNCVKNRHLTSDAMPTKSLPGSLSEDEPDAEPAKHEGVICDNCSEPVLGFRYKCVTCDNYDLCQTCEMQGSHPKHYMLRIPKSIKFKLADDLLSKWQKLFKAEHVTPDYDSSFEMNDGLSSDDEPVTKYIKNYDSGIDLAEDVKTDIRNEVARAIQAVQVKKKKIKSDRTIEESSDHSEIPNKKIRLSNTAASTVNNFVAEKVPEMAFADVSDIKCDVKPDVNSTPNDTENVNTQPVAYVKLLGEDFSQLMIELVQQNDDVK